MLLQEAILPLTCPQLPLFDTADLATVTKGFAEAPSLKLEQSWKASPEPDFAPGAVRVGWRSKLLLIFAELEDADIYTNASGPNQRLWELGDAFEIFLRPRFQPAYAELQIAPNNVRLQLNFASEHALAWSRKSGSLADAINKDIIFASRTWVLPESHRWYVLAQIPMSAVCNYAGELQGSVWHFSFCRYDYTTGRSEPVISSTSPFTQPDFHRLSEWRIMQFV